MTPPELIKDLLNRTAGMTPEKIIRTAYEQFGSKVAFASSLGEEDQTITDMIAKTAPEIEVFTIDTGRLFQDTYDLIAKTQKRYPMPFKIYFPDNEAVQDMVASQGLNLFYESVGNRKLCCGIRKVEPLRRALKGKDAWITGLRRDQSVTRTDVQSFEWDESNQKIKINPLVNWTLDQVRTYNKQHDVDISRLHAQGFVSIGCAPCTRAIKRGEDIRAGRWWWENPEQKECGLHNNPKRAEALKNKAVGNNEQRT